MTKQHERENKLNEIQTFNSETFNEQTQANAFLAQRRNEYNDFVAKVCYFTIELKYCLIVEQFE